MVRINISSELFLGHYVWCFVRILLCVYSSLLIVRIYLFLLIDIWYLSFISWCHYPPYFLCLFIHTNVCVIACSVDAAGTWSIIFETVTLCPQLCRYLYYLGRIRTIQLEYTDSKECLLQAARKAPSTARGFRIQCNKWAVIVRLLLGEIPERTTFMQQGMQKPLRPYFELTNVSDAFLSGNLFYGSQVLVLQN